MDGKTVFPFKGSSNSIILMRMCIVQVRRKTCSGFATDTDQKTTANRCWRNVDIFHHKIYSKWNIDCNNPNHKTLELWKILINRASSTTRRHLQGYYNAKNSKCSEPILLGWMHENHKTHDNQWIKMNSAKLRFTAMTRHYVNHTWRNLPIPCLSIKAIKSASVNNGGAVVCPSVIRISVGSNSSPTV